MDISGMRILSVDDNESNLLMVEVHAKNLGIQVDSYLDPTVALLAVEAVDYDLIIIDYMMPVLDGLQFIEKFRKNDKTTPIIMITAVGDDDEVHYKALKNGATDFLKKPLNGVLFKLRVKNLLSLKKAQKLIQDRALHLEEEVTLATRKIIDREMETLSVIAKTSEYKDAETGDHVKRVSQYSAIIAKGYGLNEEFVDIVYHAAPLHDVGKVGIPDSILLKKGPLTENEWKIMRRHPLIGYEILKRSKSEYLNAGAVIAFSHHEKFDGTGYPKGLEGDNIPLLGRIVALADVFDALTTCRPYKDAWTFDEAVEEIKRLKGSHFDPNLVDIFERHLTEFNDVYLSVD